jgi:Holliday junction resolvase RusA-like endonuclease
MTPAASFFAPGIPAPKGSRRTIQHKHTGKLLNLEANPNVKPFTDSIIYAARRAWQGREPINSAAFVDLQFLFPPTKKALKAWQREYKPWMLNKPDLDKLQRTVLDALVVAGVLVDDSRVVRVNAGKSYAFEHDMPGVKVEVKEAD